MENNCGESYRFGERRHGGMGMLLPLLALPLVIGFVRHAARKQHMMMHGMYGGPDSEYAKQRRAAFQERIQPFFNELHKKAHAAETKAAETASEPKAAEAL